MHKSLHRNESQAPFGLHWNKMTDKSLSAQLFSFLTCKFLLRKVICFTLAKTWIYTNFSAETFKTPYFYLFSEGSLVQRTSKIDNPPVHWPKPLVWGKWTPSFSHPAYTFKYITRTTHTCPIFWQIYALHYIVFYCIESFSIVLYC